jgi:hypothetical protein
MLRLIANGGHDRHHGLRLSQRLLPKTPETRPHLDRAGQGVEEGGPTCVGTRILRVATTGAGITLIVATVVLVVLLVGLLQ